MKKNFKKMGVLAMTMAMALSVITGCSDSKVKEVSYDYDASEYIKLGQYKGIEVTVGDYSVTDEDLQNVIDQLLERYTNYSPVDREAKLGDSVNLTIDAYISGNRVEGFSSNDYDLVLGSGEFIVEGFEDQIVGLKTGESRAVTGLKVPEDFTTEAAFAGRAITFNVTVDAVNEPVLPTYADDFVTAVTENEFTTVEEYNKELTRMLEENAETNRYNDKYNLVLETIVANTEVIKELPEEYIATKVEGIQKELDRYTILYELTDEEYLQQYYGVNTAEELAKEQITLEFIFQEIIKQENLTITQKYYDENLLATANDRNYTTTEKFIENYTENGVVQCMLLDKAAELIVDSAVEK